MTEHEIHEEIHPKFDEHKASATSTCSLPKLQPFLSTKLPVCVTLESVSLLSCTGGDSKIDFVLSRLTLESTSSVWLTRAVATSYNLQLTFRIYTEGICLPITYAGCTLRRNLLIKEEWFQHAKAVQMFTGAPDCCLKKKKKTWKIVNYRNYHNFHNSIWIYSVSH